MKHDFDNTSHPTHHLLDPVEIEMTDALDPRRVPNFLSVYHLEHAQESSSKNEMN
jgi:hypothetical protein